MSSVSLKHGSRSLVIDVDDFDLLGVLEPASEPTSSSDAEAVAAVDEALGSPIGSAGAGGARARRDDGRDLRLGQGPGHARRPLHAATDRRAGPSRDPPQRHLRLHGNRHARPVPRADRPLVLGPSFPDDIRVIGHDCTDRDAQVELGTTSFGNRVVVNRAAYEQDVKVLTGRITHHYFAGFTAGRKAVLPGVSALGTIQFNHRLVLSGPPEHPRHPDVGNTWWCS